MAQLLQTDGVKRVRNANSAAWDGRERLGWPASKIDTVGELQSMVFQQLS